MKPTKPSIMIQAAVGSLGLLLAPLVGCRKEESPPRAAVTAVAVPADFEVRWGSGATHAHWGREEGTLNAQGELVWLKTRGLGPNEMREESRGRATPEQLAALWRTIQENRFFELEQHYSNPDIQDGFSSFILVIAEGRRHSSAVMNTSQERFSRVQSALDQLSRVVLAPGDPAKRKS